MDNLPVKKTSAEVKIESIVKAFKSEFHKINLNSKIIAQQMMVPLAYRDAYQIFNREFVTSMHSLQYILTEITL